MFEYFAHNPTITASNDKDTFWIWVAGEWKMRDHFLVAET
jgi:hypothetical protein